MFDMLIAETFKNVTSYGKRFKSKALYNLRNWVESQLTFMSGFFDNYSPTQCTYMIFTGMTDFPKCPICGGPINDPKAFRNIYTGFAITCSRKCGETYRQHAYINTCMAKYGKPHYAMDKTRYEQSRDAMERKYGVRNVFQRTDVKKTIKQTLKTRYGNENYINFEKARETRLRRYGKWESDDSLQKRKRTYFKHYGVEHNMKSEVGIKEYEAAIQQKFGVKNVSQLDAIKKKKIETCKSHFGVDYP